MDRACGWSTSNQQAIFKIALLGSQAWLNAQSEHVRHSRDPASVGNAWRMNMAVGGCGHGSLTTVTKEQAYRMLEFGKLLRPGFWAECHGQASPNSLKWVKHRLCYRRWRDLGEALAETSADNIAHSYVFPLHWNEVADASRARQQGPEGTAASQNTYLVVMPVFMRM